MPKSRRNKRALDVNSEELIHLYVSRGLSLRACSVALGISTHGGLSWRLKKAGVILRIGKFQEENQAAKLGTGGWKGGKKPIPCTQCGAELLRFPSLIRDKNFCGFVCHGLWLSENRKGDQNPNFGNDAMVGEGNPNWKGGIACEPYAPIWVDKRFKSGIRERDNHTCQNPSCRKNSDGLTIHHIDYDKKNCDLKNLITLCVSCNCRANYDRDFWEAGYTAIIEKKYMEAINVV
jgi:hypothetical protein